ncbi:FadD7 family fatty acid--CoA ligase [Mycobacterium sp. M26]|uniref:FadD7 family fatty acid--CoA ligase n=1 Tax=Mycobacterium sp. M26 TaxID=1762962 RepID=UPI00073F200C|nr:FadD7 family fatty acid--CoA ligase [Mycobacterium sp. M26]
MTTQRWLGHVIDEIALAAPDSTALIISAERRRISYGELADMVVTECQRLQRSPLQPGDVVALQASNCLAFVVGLLAAARAGLVIAPFDPALPDAERRARAEMAHVRVTLVDGHQKSLGGDPAWLLESDGISIDGTPRTYDEPLPGLTAGDALLMFTSGTTGTPKMVPWTHDNIRSSVTGIVGAYRLGRADATVAVMPLFHGHGLIAGLLAPLASGGRILLPARGRFSASTFWDDMNTVEATWYTAAPTIHRIVLDRAGAELTPASRDRLRFIRSCSAPLSPATARQLEETFAAPLLAAYGMTEATHQASSVLASHDEAARLNTVGMPTGLSVRIADADGNSVPAGSTGEIWLSGPTIVRGYLNNPAATAGTFVDGWLRTGDLGAVNEDGTLSVKGRIKEQINRGGEKISPEHVEQVLASHPDVAQAVVFGIPDALYGERVAAVVVTRDHAEPDLGAYSGGRLASFEIPEHITFADELPLTAKGSVDRAAVARQYAQ